MTCGGAGKARCRSARHNEPRPAPKRPRRAAKLAPVQELLPGLFHWYATHPSHGMQVSCHHVGGSGTTIDPLLPEEGIEWFDGHRPQRVVLSTRHHLRHAEQLADRFGCPILAHEDGLYEFEGGPVVEGFSFGDRLAPDVKALTMDAISPDDTVLHIEVAEGALLFAHGDPIVGGGKEALRDFAQRPEA